MYVHMEKTDFHQVQTETLLTFRVRRMRLLQSKDILNHGYNSYPKLIVCTLQHNLSSHGMDLYSRR